MPGVTQCRPEHPLQAHEKWGFVDGNLKNLDSGLCLGGKMVLAACEGPDALNISRHPSVGGVGTIQQGGSCLATHVPPAASHTAALGGSVAVLDGLGAGDYRRVAAWEGNTITLDKPFATSLDGSSFINVGPFRGRSIFNHNAYSDGGAFQLYAYVSRHDAPGLATSTKRTLASQA